MDILKRLFTIVVAVALVFTFSLVPVPSLAYAEDEPVLAEEEAIDTIDAEVQEDQELAEAEPVAEEESEPEEVQVSEEALMEGEPEPEPVLIDISTCTIDAIPAQTYTGKAIEPDVKIMSGDLELIKDLDYTLKYENNLNAGTARVTITGINDFTGEVKKNFTINKKAITPTIAFSKTTFTYNGKVQKPTVTIKDGTTKISSDYYDLTAPTGMKNVGTYTYKVVLKGNYTGSASKSFKITAKKITPKVTLSKTSFVYNGKAQKPTVTVKDGSTKLTTASYKITYSSGRKKVGTYKVTVKLKGNYSGSKTVSFKINPKGTYIKSLAKGSNKITVKWKKQSTQVTGYQVEYSAKSDFSKSVKKTIKSASTTSVVLKSLTKGTKYYVRVRTYKTVNGTKYYSKWSDKKSKKVTSGKASKIAKAPKISISAKDMVNTIKWAKVTGATGYQVYYRKGEKGSFKLLKTVTELKATQKVTHGVYYYYKVRAFKEKKDGSRIYSGYSNEDNMMIYYNPNYSVVMLSDTNNEAYSVGMVVTNNGIAKMRIYSRNSQLIDHDYYSYDRDLHMIDTDSFDDISYVDIPAGSTKIVMFRVKGDPTWYDQKSKIYYEFKYDGVEYYAYSSYYYGSTYYKNE